jgi:regulator of cell morphogenesis and NO signaling
MSDHAQAETQTAGDIPTDTAALCDHIVERYHDVHRRDLPELIALARKVEAVHRDHPLAPKGLADALEAVLESLLDHMTKEERVLCPAIRGGFAGSLFGPIAVMRHEHDHHGEEIRAIEASALGFEAPEDACNSWRALYSALDKFAADLAEHIDLENNVLFPRFEHAKSRATIGVAKAAGAERYCVRRFPSGSACGRRRSHSRGDRYRRAHDRSSGAALLREGPG